MIVSSLHYYITASSHYNQSSIFLEHNRRIIHPSLALIDQDWYSNSLLHKQASDDQFQVTKPRYLDRYRRNLNEPLKSPGNKAKFFEYFVELHSNFRKTYPKLYKNIMDERRKQKVTHIAIKPPALLNSIKSGGLE